MDAVLVAVAIISLGLAVTMSVVAWTLIKAERQRAAARIEALEALAFSDDALRAEVAEAPKTPIVPARSGRPFSRDTEALSIPAVPPVRSDEQPHLRDWDAVIRSPAGESDSRLDGALPGVRGRTALPVALFDAESASSPGSRRVLAIAAIGLLLAAGYATASAMRAPQRAAAVSLPIPDAEPRPLELLSLRHTADANGAFSVTGFVQNPRDGRDLTNVEAVVYLFDANDQYFMTGRAPLETSDMRPGTDSAFEVHVPKATNVSRYRVGFRQADGTVVTHLDRRGQAPDGSTETVLGDQIRPAGGMR